MHIISLNVLFCSGKNFYIFASAVVVVACFSFSNILSN